MARGVISAGSQYVWSLGVVTGWGSRCGHWVWSLGGALDDVINSQCVCL